MTTASPSRTLLRVLCAILALTLLSSGAALAVDPLSAGHEVSFTLNHAAGDDGAVELSAADPRLGFTITKAAGDRITSVTLSVWDRSSFLKAVSLTPDSSTDSLSAVVFSQSMSAPFAGLLSGDTLYQCIVTAMVEGRLCQSSAWRFRLTDAASALPPSGAASTPVAVASSGLNPLSLGTAHAAAQQRVLVDGKPVFFDMYALKDSQGGETNYVRLVDLAYVLQGTPAQFAVGWEESTNMITLTSGQAPLSTSAAMKTPFSGNRVYRRRLDPTTVDGVVMDLQAFILTDDESGDYTYYKLRDLGQVLGFNVGWSTNLGMFIQTNKPYTDAD